ncbi:putative quinol monooxygenase [Nocardia carnea]|uniref:Quinol monooxygenase n=1 Tax=Nocardia carnea TaxID=37328 RepID=A0ABW7TKM2_9NOCA|nr:antibiotic biosynthesis monooxygenase family protein [Nocardia carnea]
MVIVAGYLLVAPEARDAYLAGCADVVGQARSAPGCLDFAISADLYEPGRINILERWESQDSVEAFRGSGTGAEQSAAIIGAAVAEYDIAGIRSLT